MFVSTLCQRCNNKFGRRWSVNNGFSLGLNHFWIAELSIQPTKLTCISSFKFLDLGHNVSKSRLTRVIRNYMAYFHERVFPVHSRRGGYFRNIRGAWITVKMKNCVKMWIKGKRCVKRMRLETESGAKMASRRYAKWHSGIDDLPTSSSSPAPV